MRNHNYSPLIGISVCVLFLCGCIIKDSLAPGCRKTIGIPAMGGCSGKPAIVDLEVLSAPDCVLISANNCNGGVLNIRNTFTETISLDEIMVDPYGSISLNVKMVAGSVELNLAHGNFSEFIPEDDLKVELAGLAGVDPIQIAFTKTKPL